ncbi:hypothetical protein Droror1_Dr00006773 [Drosera rotundifolia]
MKMETTKQKAQVLLRLSAAILLILAACLTHTNAQTKVLFDIYEKRATSKDLPVLIIGEYVFFAAASYNLLQVMRLFSLSAQQITVPKFALSYSVLPWLFFILDQAVVYMLYAINFAEVGVAIPALFGVDSLQWLKMCSYYTRFCYQAAGHVLCSFTAAFLLIFVAAISASNVLRFYSPKHFLSLKRSLK